MATVVGECAAVLCCLLEAVQAIEDPSSLQNSCTGRERFGSPESNGTVCFHRPVHEYKVAVLRIVFVVVLLPTIREIRNCILLYVKEL